MSHSGGERERAVRASGGGARHHPRLRRDVEALPTRWTRQGGRAHPHGGDGRRGEGGAHRARQRRVSAGGAPGPGEGVRSRDHQERAGGRAHGSGVHLSRPGFGPGRRPQLRVRALRTPRVDV